ncbi:hypothetical protein GCM10009111_24450 [Colwellia asteriadis]|uniref:N-acetyltransferase domain-containing protein n=1 Tax=Colwellia asteriadis TaxID=517723 RepID=A0ABN1L8L1_9GAMM
MSYINDLSITKALKSDKKAILRFYKSQQYSARFIGLDQAYLIKSENVIIACVIISQLTPTNEQYFLHGLVVAKSHQRQGIARLLLQHVQNSHQPLVCFTQPILAPLYLSENMIQVSEKSVELKLSPAVYTRYQTYLKTQSCLVALVLGL